MSNENTGDNPYNARNHEDESGFKRDDVLAVAGLLGQVSGSLSDIDSKNVGSDNENVRAKKLDPKNALNNIVGSAGRPPPVQKHHPPPLPPPPPLREMETVLSDTVPNAQVIPVSPHPPVFDTSGIESRLSELESIIESYKKIVKFKRGISYSISTAKIKGEFKDPATILDLISTELAKQTKIITLKLNDSTKPKK